MSHKLKNARTCAGCRALDTTFPYSRRCTLGYEVSTSNKDTALGVLRTTHPEELCPKPTKVSDYYDLQGMRVNGGKPL